MKILIVLIFILNILSFGQQITFRGKVVDAETNLPLTNANITVFTRVGVGTTTDQNGDFELITDFKNTDTISVSYIGYRTENISIEQLLSILEIKSLQENLFYTFHLNKKPIPAQTILVEASVGKKGITPIAFDQLKAKEIEKTYTVYDIPKYLSNLPSTTFYSESGNSIGTIM